MFFINLMQKTIIIIHYHTGDSHSYCLCLSHRYIIILYLRRTLKKNSIIMIGEAISNYRVRVEIF